MKYNIVLVDLDETIFDSTQRIQEATINGVIDWDVAMDSERVKYDPVIEGAVEAVNKIADMGFQICYLTGRSRKCWIGTSIALDNAGFPGTWIEMRDIDDLRPVESIKSNLIKEIKVYGNIIATVDDDYSGTARDMYLAYNIAHFHTFSDSLMKHLENARIRIG